MAERTSCSFGSPADLAPGACDASPSASMEEIQVELQCADLWKRFHDIGTEMIITKAGRRMFPAMRVKIAGLDPHQQYYIAMDIVPVDNKRYRCPPPPTAGNVSLSFISLYLYIYLQIILHSMHKYQPRVHIIRKDSSSELSANKPVPSGEGVKTFSFSETVFTTVTAYQNQQITRLKIDRNPFAKGFRDSGRNRTGLEAIMETYAFWRPPVRTLTFEDFTNMQKQQGGSTGTSPTTSSTGTPSPSGAAHLLSPSCSPPAFHLAPNTFNVGCRESQLCNLGLSEYPACARSNMAALQGYGGLADGSYGRSSPSSAHMFGSGHHHVQQGSYNAFSLHNPYNLYGYNFPASPRLAASPEKPQAGLLCSSAPAGAFAERQYLPNGGMDTMHMIGNAAGGQQGGSSCDGRQYGSSSQMSMHMV
uniref:T-box transcription factor 15 n=1 Tax=Xiphophorus couchianus TaxID=32473 RepID=A0A3B5MWZ7_9TELE